MITWVVLPRIGTGASANPLRPNLGGASVAVLSLWTGATQCLCKCVGAPAQIAVVEGAANQVLDRSDIPAVVAFLANRGVTLDVLAQRAASPATGALE